jgi:AcrR family transcriptional regulator
MSPEDRRAALIAATVPLLREHGAGVTTRQIARAAGVAEGTIFGVFPDKDSLVHAALRHALDPADTLAALDAIDRDADLRTRLTAAAALVNRRFADNALLLSVARGIIMTAASPTEARERMTDARDRLLAALTSVVEPDRARLRREPAVVARLLLLLAGANTYGPFGDPAQFTGDEMVALLLDGLLVRADPNRDTEVP